jgi:hypothetical protein
MDKIIACTSCGRAVSALIDQVLELSAVTICQCRCGEVVVISKPAPRDSPTGLAFGCWPEVGDGRRRG